MEVFNERFAELVNLYHDLQRNLTWKDVVLYTSVPVITWYTYRILIQPFLSPLRKIPGRPYVPIVGNMFEALKKEAMSNTIEWMLKHNSRFIRFYHLFGAERLLVADPEIVKYINVTNNANFQHLQNSPIARFLPRFVLATVSDEHKSLRRLLNPVFSRAVVDSFISVFEQATKRVIENWHAELNDNEFCEVEAQQYMCRLGIDAICECGFDYKMNSISEPHAAGVMSFRRLLVSFRTRLVDMIPFFNKLPFKDNIQRREDYKFFKKTINNMIAEKKAIMNNTQKEKANKKNEDILSILLKARDENDKGLSDDSLSAQIGGFLFAGFETTSTALTWILLNLAEHEDVQDKVRAEIQQVLPSSDQPLTRTDFDKLTYMVCVINETLRLFPPATVYFRQSVKDDTLNGYFIPAKTIIGVSVSGLHRHPDNWENPDSFIPERFQEEYDHYKFMPFAHGPLMCIGKRFAMTEIQTVLTLLLRSFKFHKVPSYKYRRIQNLTMVPDPPLVLRIEKI